MQKVLNQLFLQLLLFHDRKITNMQ